MRPGSASSMIGVAIAVATTTTATTPSGAPVCRLAFPVSPAISDSYEIIIVIYRRRKNRPRNRTQPLSCPRQWHAEPAQGGSTLPLAPDILLFIAEERPHGWTTVYRGTVASAGSAEDLATLEDAMPVRLLEYLLLWGAPQVAIIKIEFALLPGEEQLPELVNP